MFNVKRNRADEKATLVHVLCQSLRQTDGEKKASCGLVMWWFTSIEIFKQLFENINQ